MAINNTVYVNVRMIEGDLAPELNIYYFRLVAAHFFELCSWLRETPPRWPEIRKFLVRLPEDAKRTLAELEAFADPRHTHFAALSRSRHTLFHYPDLHPAKADAGAEELANALAEVADFTSTIEGGVEWASFRACFADEVALQFLAPHDEDWHKLFEELQGPMFGVVEFGQAVLLEYMKAADPERVEIFGR
jgi:hypothetical protein